MSDEISIRKYLTFPAGKRASTRVCSHQFALLSIDEMLKQKKKREKREREEREREERYLKRERETARESESECCAARVKRGS